jgi:hypothetical protein
MSHFYRLFLLLLLVPLVAFAFNSSRFGSRGFLHVQSASTLYKGTFDVETNLNFYTKVGDYLGDQKPANFAAVNWWDVQFNSVFSYGALDHLDLTLMWRLYQDTNRLGLNGEQQGENVPEDLFLDIKTGSWGVSNNRFHLGFLVSGRIPTASYYNYFFEPYSAGGVEYGFTGLASYFNDPYLHDRSYSVHLNLGYYNHNDAGKTLYELGDQIWKADGNSTEIQYGLAFSYPTELFQLNLEFWGINFMSQPDTMAYSRENFMYLTPMVRFTPNPWFNFYLGLDVRLSSAENTSSSLLPAPSSNLNLPNYPSWKLHLGLEFRIMPVGGRYGAEKPGQTKVDFYESLLKDSQKSDKIEEELRRLRKEREQAEKELEELRQMLEEEK